MSAAASSSRLAERTAITALILGSLQFTAADIDDDGLELAIREQRSGSAVTNARSQHLVLGA